MTEGTTCLMQYQADGLIIGAICVALLMLCVGVGIGRRGE